MKRTAAKISFKLSREFKTRVLSKLPTIIIIAGVSVGVVALAVVLYMQQLQTTHNKAIDMAQTAALGASPVKQMTVHDAKGAWLATFTYGARTVITKGPVRTFSEPTTTSVTVKSTTWVRLYSAAFNGVVDQAWLDQTIKDNNQADAAVAKPDILAIAMQYIANAPVIKDANGMQIAGDASYGPLKIDGKRQEGSDFNDYLGISHAYAGSIDKPELAQKGSLDCSGFQRMVWGYRGGMSLQGSQLDPTGSAIPRRAYQIEYGTPGIVVAPNTGQQITNLNQLQVGDLVFHDASTNDGKQIDHLGIFLGMDTEGHYRFISSRKTANGPTMGDVGGKSILDGNGLYAASFRAIRRF